MFGLFDTHSSLWMGGEEGPFLFEDARCAEAAAQIVDRSLKQPTGRTRPRPFAPEPPRLRDARPLLVPREQALGPLEEER